MIGVIVLLLNDRGTDEQVHTAATVANISNKCVVVTNVV